MLHTACGTFFALLFLLVHVADCLFLADLGICAVTADFCPALLLPALPDFSCSSTSYACLSHVFPTTSSPAGISVVRFCSSHVSRLPWAYQAFFVKAD